MGLFGKLFEKKQCSICGGEIGLLGNRKLEDGNMCKNCAAKLSPFFSERRSSTVAQIQEQLQYRENNKAAVDAFQVTRSIGDRKKIYLDETKGQFIISSTANFREENPDVIDISAVTDVREDIREFEREDKTKDKEGKSISYVPPRYIFCVNYDLTIYVNHPYFDKIDLSLSNGSIELNRISATRMRRPDPRSNIRYQNCEREAMDIRSALLYGRNRSFAKQAGDMHTAAPMGSSVENPAKSTVRESNPGRKVTCPWCGSETVDEGNGICGLCGGNLNG